MVVGITSSRMDKSLLAAVKNLKSLTLVNRHNDNADLKNALNPPAGLPFLANKFAAEEVTFHTGLASGFDGFREENWPHLKKLKVVVTHHLHGAIWYCQPSNLPLYLILLLLLNSKLEPRRFGVHTYFHE